MRTAALIAFAFIAGLSAASRASAQADFAAQVAREIGMAVRFDPPGIALTSGDDGPFAFYGEAMNQFREVACERSASFGIIAKANIAGAIHVGICVREAQRVRKLASGAQPALAGTLALLLQGAATPDAATLDKFGWKYSKTVGADGAEEHFYPLIAVGHGVVSVTTLVRIPRGARRAIVVQGDTRRLCENYGLEGRTPLCSNLRQTFADIAQRLESRFRD